MKSHMAAMAKPLDIKWLRIVIVMGVGFFVTTNLTNITFDAAITNCVTNQDVNSTLFWIARNPGFAAGI